VHIYEIKSEQRVIDQDNAGSFFRFVNSKLSCKRGLGALSSDSGGFLSGRSTTSNLFETLKDWTLTINNSSIHRL